jgi:hypothetical protein
MRRKAIKPHHAHGQRGHGTESPFARGGKISKTGQILFSRSMNMKWLKSLVFLVFLMAVGVVLERVGIALYERGSKVDWKTIQKALLDEHNRKTVAATTAPAGEAAAKPSDWATISREIKTDATDPIYTPSRSARHGTSTSKPRYESSKNKVAWEAPRERDANSTGPISPEPILDRSPSISPPMKMTPTLAIRPSSDAPKSPAIKTDEPVALPPVGPVVEPGPVAVSEPTPVAPMPTPTFPGPTPVLAQPTPALKPSEPTPAVVEPTPVPVVQAVPMTPGPVDETPPVTPGPVPFIPPPDNPVDDHPTRVVCHLNSMPAGEIAKSLSAIFSPKEKQQPSNYGVVSVMPSKDIIIVPETVSNSLLLSGPKSLVDEAKRMAKEMDQPAAMVRLEVRMSEIDSDKVKKTEEAASEKNNPADENAKGTLQVISATEEGTPLVRADVTTLNNQESKVTLGRLEPQVAGSFRDKNGSTVNTVQNINLGTDISFTPRVEGDKTVSLNLSITDSRCGPIEEGVVIAEVKEGHPIRTPRIEQFSSKTTVRLEDGKTLRLVGIGRDGKTGKEQLISITAHILRIGEAKPAKDGEGKK